MTPAKLLTAAIGNSFILLVVFFLLFPVVAPAILWIMRVVLEGLNSL